LFKRVFVGAAATAFLLATAGLAAAQSSTPVPPTSEASAPAPTDDGSARLDLARVGMGSGRASRPSSDVTTDPGTTETEPPAEVSGYRTSGVVAYPLPVGFRPYDTPDILPRGGTGLMDASGVRMFRMSSADPKIWDHPVAQAQYALLNLNSYRLTQDAIYLQRAEANAQRLIDRRTEYAGAWYYPYPFDWSFYGDTTDHAPWYSAMAQGQALSVFVRLFQVTGDPTWKTAADATFTSFVNAPVVDNPFASWVDTNHDLWLEEYPQPDIVSSEKVLNGHIFAAFGIEEYLDLTADPRAAQLFDGAVTTVQDTLLSVFRQPRWSSYYSMRHKQVNLAYHQVHVDELLDLFQITHRARFAAAANILRGDYPLSDVTGRATLGKDLHRVFRVKQGKVTRSRVVHLTRKRLVSVGHRTRTHDHGVMLAITSGKYAGWYAKERYGRAWMAQPTDAHTYSPRRLNVVFGPGTYVGYRYSKTGHRYSTLTVRFTRRSSAPTSRSAIVGGQSAFRLDSGTWAGYWVPMQSGMAFS
jgi:hypothetical protein